MKKFIGLFVILVALFIFVFLPYIERHREISAPPSHILAQCVLGASNTYNVPTDVIIAIMYVEGGRIGQQVANVNGTYDLGIMQVNSLWVPQLAQLWNVNYGTAYASIRDSGCENIYVGAWILKKSIATTGTLYDGIAYYHSATRGLGAAYASKVIGTMQKKGLSFAP